MRVSVFCGRPRSGRLIRRGASEHRGLGARPRAKLLQDVADVNLHRDLADEEGFGDFLVRSTVFDVLENLLLSPRQATTRNFPLWNREAKPARGADVPAACKNRTDGRS